MNINPVLKKEIISTSRSMKFPIFILIISILCAFTFVGALVVSDESVLNEILDTETYYYEDDEIYYGSYDDAELGIHGAKNINNLAESGESVRYVIQFFLAMEFLALYLVIPSYCASSIAEERQQQTYEMLITTGYSRKKIIFGKMAGGIVIMFTYIAASLPFFIGMLGMYSVTVKRLFVIVAGLIINAYFCAGVGAFAGAKAKHSRTSGVLGAAWIMVITFLTVVIPLAWSGIKNLYINYDYYFGYSTKYVETNIGSIKYLMLFNPFFSVCSLVFKSVSVDYTVEDLAEDFDVSLHICNGVIDHWAIISLFLLAIMGTIFFYLASVRINPLKGLCRYKKKISPQINGTISDDIL